MTYKIIEEGNYSVKGLKAIHPKLHKLENLAFTSQELKQEALMRNLKMSIQGVQPKLSAKLNIHKNIFELVDSNGKFILKPQSQYDQVPENEDLSMHLAKEVGIEVPMHGLIPSKDGTLVYFIKRFDRVGHKNKIFMEDFAQLAGKSRDTKYDYSTEKIILLIKKHCTFPKIEMLEFFKRMIFNFLIGNEDMHLKNYSLINTDGIIKLAPSYDYVNTTIVLKNPQEQFALPLRGKKKGLTKQIFLNYLGKEILDLPEKVILQTVFQFKDVQSNWHEWITNSFLSEDKKEVYRKLLEKRCSILEI